MSSSLKILIVSMYYPPDMGANSAQASNVAMGLAQRGYNVKVITTFPHYPEGKIPHSYQRNKLFKREINESIEIIRIWTPPIPSKGRIRRIFLFSLFSFLHFIVILLFIRDVNVLFIISPWPPSPFTIPDFVFTKLFKKYFIIYEADSVPDILFGMGIIKGKFNVKLLKFIGSFLEKVADAVITYNESIASMIRSRVKNPAKVHVVPLGVNTNLFKPSDISVYKKKMFLNKFVVMYSGIFSELYDFDTLLESAKFLSKNEKILFVIRGGGELRDYIIRKIEKMKLKNVVVLGRLDSPYELINILNCADIFIVPMKKNIPIWSDIAIPSKIYEFLSCGKPVICCARGATQELIKNTKAGIIIRTGNSQLLSEAILKLFFDRVLRSQLGENARKSALKEFEISKVINRIELILKSLGKGS